MNERKYAAASFRDPAGRVFKDGNDCFRSVTPYGLADYNHFADSGLAQKLMEKKLITRFEPHGKSGDDLILKLDPLPVLIYPYEWCFGQLRDAALLTLDINLEALEYGMILKDATAFNVSWRDGRPVFIDHGSFTIYRENEPWLAYRQFVMNFLGLLLLMKYRDVQFQQYLRHDLSGAPVCYVSRMLPKMTYFKLNPLIHIHLHAYFDRVHSDSRGESKAASAQLPRRKLVNILRTLREYIAGLSLPYRSSEWGDYYNDTNYSAAAFDAKHRIVDEFCARIKPGRVVDLGANNGEFSRIAARHARDVIAVDVDPVAIDQLYSSFGKQDVNIYPMLQDLNNPSPGVGILNAERDSFFDRINGEIVLGLALIHHLRIGSNWTLEHIVNLFSGIAPNAVVEFVPKHDSQVQRLLKSRKDICGDWNLETVEQAFLQRYRNCKIEPIPESERSILILTR